MNIKDAKPGSPGAYILIWWQQPLRLTFDWKSNTLAGVPTFTPTTPGDTDE